MASVVVSPGYVHLSNITTCFYGWVDLMKNEMQPHVVFQGQFNWKKNVQSMFFRTSNFKFT